MPEEEGEPESRERPASPGARSPGLFPEVQRKMDLNWILLVLLGWGLGLLFVAVLMRMAGNQDRAARHEQKRLDPLADVTITQAGDPTDGPVTDSPRNGR